MSVFATGVRRTQREFRAALARRESDAAEDLIREYGRAYHAINSELLVLIDKIEAARAGGQEVNLSWLFQAERLASLERQVEAEIDEFARYADRRIREEQSGAVRLAGDHAGMAAREVSSVAVAWQTLPSAALEELVGASHSGPLRNLLDELGPQASARVRSELVKGVALGRNPRQIARGVRKASGMTLNRSLAISRTETLRAYRSATLEHYRRNPAIVKGWVWTAALDRRTCPVCADKHGSFHPLDEEMDTHPNCRCTCSPAVNRPS